MGKSDKHKRSAVCDYGADIGKYVWDQTPEEVTVSVPMHRTDLKGRDITCEITRTHLKLGIKGQALIIDGELGGEIKKGESTWFLDEGKTVEITLIKQDPPKGGDGWWASVVKGDPEIDLDLIEGSKYLDDSLLRQLKEKKKLEREAKAQEAAGAAAPSAAASEDTQQPQ
eukprot:TRINITY_DN14053_c0_g1_i1.p1 TRINITY_DN14053_c0_g1~~TRINITY_DN14053_c0_g1_i1.p1  ORF type:complete len:179 (-),score=50.34 TRINITY_DN14053_c0_g1_i1:37-546(-)